MGRHAQKGIHLTDKEIHRAFEGGGDRRYPPVLSVKQAADLADVSVSTLYDWSSRGKLIGCAVKRGKRLRILRDRFVKFLFEDKEL